MDVLLFLIFLLWLAGKIWPDNGDPRSGDRDIFIPFEGMNGDNNSDQDPYFPDEGSNEF